MFNEIMRTICLLQTTLKPLQKAHESLAQTIKAPLAWTGVHLTLIQQHGFEVVGLQGMQI